MNMRQAKAYVLRVSAAELRHHIGNGSEWLKRPLRQDGVAVAEDGSFTQADQERILRALGDVADELEARAVRLGAPVR